MSICKEIKDVCKKIKASSGCKGKKPKAGAKKGSVGVMGCVCVFRYRRFITMWIYAVRLD
jgi:hypothetical protein